MTALSRKAVSLPPLRNHPGSYIDHTLKILDASSKDEKHIKIDGYFGDHRMRLFRLKDRKEYYNKNKSIFTATFTQALLPEKQLDEEVKNQIEEIIKS